jgi:uncharacterized repeat protein (TIGR03803 family)
MMMVALAMSMMTTPVVQAQTYTVLHNFTGGSDGGNPITGLAMDVVGNLYGTTAPGLNNGSGKGSIFKLKHQGSSWLLSPLYNFTGGNDGADPYGTLVFGRDGTIYGNTYYGGGSGCGGMGCGTVYHLHPQPTRPPSPLSPWTEVVLYRFTGAADGANPNGPVTFDASGNIYGTAFAGAQPGCAPLGCGTVYELTKSGNNYTQSVLWSFNPSDQGRPGGGVTFDSTGDLFGTATGCDGGGGDVYELVKSGSGWTENVLSGNQAECPLAGVILGSDGKFYGSTALGSGNIFNISDSGGIWTVDDFLTLPGGGSLCGPDGALLRDSAGNLYGTTICTGANNLGTIFKLSPAGGGNYTYTDLHDFAGSDGAMPHSNLVMDKNGNLYGTTFNGGSGTSCTNGCGVVFEITP